MMNVVIREDTSASASSVSSNNSESDTLVTDSQSETERDEEEEEDQVQVQVKYVKDNNDEYTPLLLKGKDDGGGGGGGGGGKGFLGYGIVERRHDLEAAAPEAIPLVCPPAGEATRNVAGVISILLLGEFPLSNFLELHKLYIYITFNQNCRILQMPAGIFPLNR